MRDMLDLQSGWEAGKGPNMRWGIAVVLVVLAVAAASGAGWAQSPPAECNKFMQLRTQAQEKAAVVRTAMQKKDRKEICAAFEHFYVAEGAVLKFLEDNRSWCGIPQQAIEAAKTNHEQTLKYRTAACAEAPAQPKPPSLSDAIGTPSVDTGSNTKTGRGTLDSLNGNPLAR